MSSSIKNVAITGAAGALGKVVLEKLVASGQFNVTILRRQGSKSKFPSSITVVDVEFDSLESLKAALKGQDAVVSTVGSEGLEGQNVLVEAAAQAGVKRFLPSEFGSNEDNPKTRKLPVFVPKIKIQEQLIERAKTSGMTYTFVYNNAFLDWGLELGFFFNLKATEPTLVDDGSQIFSTTTISSVGDAVVGILNHPEETKNRAVLIESAKISQNQLLALARKADPKTERKPVYKKLDDMTDAADKRLAQGLHDFETFAPYLFRAILGPGNGGNFEKTDNDLLGVKTITEEEILDDIVKPLMQ